MKLSKTMPKLSYNGVPISDISIRFHSLDSARKFYSFFYEYELSYGETAESLSYKLYGSHDHWWILYAINNIIDPFYDWLMTDEEVDRYVELAYGDKSNDIHHYADESQKTFICKTFGTIITAETEAQCVTLGGLWEYDPESILTLSENNAEETLLPVTNHEHETNKNMTKLNIAVVPASHINQIYAELGAEVANMKRLLSARGGRK
jgi:hypothetical protein